MRELSFTSNRILISLYVVDFIFMFENSVRCEAYSKHQRLTASLTSQVHDRDNITTCTIRAGDRVHLRVRVRIVFVILYV